MDKNIVPFRTVKGKWRFRDAISGKWVENPGVDLDKIDYVMDDGITGDASSEGFQYSGGSGGGQGYGHMSTVYKGLFAPTITDETLEDMFNRDEFAHGAIMKVSRNMFDKWAEIHAFKKNGSKHESLEKSIIEFNEDWDIPNFFRRAWVPMRVKGVVLIALGLPGASDSVASKGPLSHIAMIPKSRINKFIIDLESSSPTYGEVIGAEILRVVGVENEVQVTVDEPIMVHASRFIHWRYPRLEDIDPFGLPGWLPLADYLTVKKNIDFATGEAIWQFATRKYVLITSPFTSDADFTAIKDDWKNFRSTTNFAIKGMDVSIQEFGGEGQLDPTPYYEWFTENMGPQLGISRSHLIQENETGTGAVEARRNYERDISSLQHSDVEPILKKFYRRLQELGVLQKGRLEFHWHELTELSEEERAFIQSRHGLGRNLEMRAVETALKARLSVELDDEGHVVRFFNDEGDDEHTLHPPDEIEIPGGVPKDIPPPMPPEETTMEEELLRELAQEIIRRKTED